MRTKRSKQGRHIFLCLQVHDSGLLVRKNRFCHARHNTVLFFQHIDHHLVSGTLDHLAVACQIEILHSARIQKQIHHSVKVAPVEQIPARRHLAVCSGHILCPGVALRQHGAFRHQQRFRIHKNYIVAMNGQIPGNALHDFPPVLVIHLHIILIGNGGFQHAKVRTCGRKPVDHFKVCFIRIRNCHIIYFYRDRDRECPLLCRHGNAAGIHTSGLVLGYIDTHPVWLRNVSLHIQWLIGKQRVRV